ncbi:MAG: hypothetical protein DRI71_03265 [Bacteroidetes bacterium]|nr:MAG: hypothetical protein DRI71_03265 [Bacteroidota bacterium]
MKNLIILLVSGFLLISCTEIIFEEPQPVGAKSLNSIPKELQGQFSFLILNEETLMEVGENFITGEDDKSYLSDSLIIKQVGNLYVVNKLISKGEGKEGKWEVYTLEDKGCGFVKATTFVINSDSYVEQFKTAYGGTVIGEGQEKSMIVKPDSKQFKAIMKDDSVTVSIILERVN